MTIEADDLDASDLYRLMVQGRIEACVRGTDDPARVAKFASTMIRRGRVSSDAVAKAVQDVERDSVVPFVGTSWNQRERRQRFEKLIVNLRFVNANSGRV